MSATKKAEPSHGHGPGHVGQTLQPDVSHETSDARARPLIWSGIVIFALVFVSFAFIAALLFIFGSSPAQTGNTLPANTELRLPASGPLLQQDADAEGDAYIVAETEKMESYGWVDEAAGQVRIPIERAMELTLERGITPPAPGAQGNP